MNQRNRPASRSPQMVPQYHSEAQRPDPLQSLQVDVGSGPQMPIHKAPASVSVASPCSRSSCTRIEKCGTIICPKASGVHTLAFGAARWFAGAARCARAWQQWSRPSKSRSGRRTRPRPTRRPPHSCWKSRSGINAGEKARASIASTTIRGTFQAPFEAPVPPPRSKAGTRLRPNPRRDCALGSHLAN